MDLRSRMELAGKNLLGCLSAAHGYLPYWSLGIDDDRKAEFQMTSPSHNIGRWWDAILRLEDAIGFVVPAHLEGGMLANTYAFFDNPDQVCFAPLRPELGDPIFEIHSLREGLLALNGLARYRGNRWAVAQGHRMLESIGRLSDGDGNWDWDGFASIADVYRPRSQTPLSCCKTVYLRRERSSHTGGSSKRWCGSTSRQGTRWPWTWPAASPGIT